jgi:hypothetical protein
MDWQNLDLLQAIDELWVTNGVREKFASFGEFVGNWRAQG